MQQRKHWKGLLGLLLALAMLLGVAGIGYAEEAPQNASPQRIVCLPVWAGEMLLEMMGPERIVGLSAWGDLPVLSATAELAAQVPDRVASKDLEGILMLNPDLVIIDTFSDFDGAIGDMLEGAGVTFARLASPTDFDGVLAALTTLGEAVGEPAQAAAMAQDVRARLAAVAEKVAAIPEDQRVRVMYYEDYYDPSGSSAGMLCAYGPGSTFDSIARAAGLVNVCEAENYSAVSKEKLIVEWQPQLLIVPGIVYDHQFNPSEDRGERIRQGILFDAEMAGVRAVQTRQVFALTEKYRSSTSQYMVYAVEELAKLAYPELFE